MKKRKIVSLAAALTLQASAALASSGAEGHGGRVWVCTQPDGSATYELLDYAEARKKGIAIDLGLGSTAEEKIENVLKRLDKVEPYRAELYRHRAANFYKRAKITSDVEYLNLGDVERVVAKPENCDLKQIVYQLNTGEEFPTQTKIKFNIAGKIFNQLPADQKAGLILHEITYEDAVYQGHTHSDSTMELVAEMSSPSIETLSPESWRNTLQKLGFGLHFHDLLVEPMLFEPSKNGAIVLLKNTIDSELNSISVGDTAVRLSIPSDSIVQKLLEEKAKGNQLEELLRLNSVYPVFVYSNGRVWSSPVDFDKKVTLPEFVGKISRIGLSEDGKVIRTNLIDHGKIVKNGQTLDVARDVVMNRSGQVLLAYPDSKISLVTSSGAVKKYRKGEPIYFDPQGKAADSGIFSMASDRYIQINTQRAGDSVRIGFQLCSLNASVNASGTCRQIGTSESYDLEALKQQWDMELKAYHRGMKGELQERFAYWNQGISVAVLAVGFIVSPPVAAFGIFESFAGLGAGYYLVGKYEEMKAKPDAKNNILNRHYMLTDQPIEQIQSELEQGLAKIK